MPIEIVVGIQLSLYGIGWALAAAFIAQERRVPVHGAAYALLQTLSTYPALDALIQGMGPRPR